MNDIRYVLSYNDVSLCPRFSDCRHLSDADINYKYGLFDHFYGKEFISPPIINSPMDTICSPELLNCLYKDFNFPVTIHRWFNNAKDQIAFLKECNLDKEERTLKRVFMSVGNIDKWKDWIDYLIGNWEEYEYSFLIDMANGDTITCVETTEYIRNKLSCNIMAGNVATKSGYDRLQKAGANFIRCGVGGGSACSTRTQNGFGLPTLTTVMDCANVKDNSYLIADGGIEYPGDICKAIAAGADMVMCGKIFAGTSLSAGSKYDKEGNVVEDLSLAKWSEYRGMASEGAQKAIKSKKTARSIEGVSGFVKYEGETSDVVDKILGNLKSSLAYYSGSRNWDHFKKHSKLVQITPQGWGESMTRLANPW